MNVNIVLLQIRKDIRHFRWLLIGWVGLIAFQIVAETMDLWISNYLVYEVISTLFITLALFLKTIFLAIFVCLLVQDEPQVGSSAFWFTRPISRLELVNAKALFIFLFILIPSLLLELLLMACHETTLHDMGLAIPEIILDQLSVIVPCWLLAAITPSFTFYALSSIGVFTFVIITSIIVELLKFIGWLEVADDNAMALAKSTGFIVSLLIVIAGTGIIVFQYLSRRTRNSFILAGIFLVLISGVGHGWRYNFLQNKPIPVNENVLDTGRVGIQADSNIRVNDDYSPRLFGNRKKTKIIGGDFVVTGLPPSCFIKVKKISSIKLKFENSDISGLVTNPSRDSMYSERNDDAIEQTLGTTLVIKSYFMGQVNAPLLKINLDEYVKYQSASGTYSAEAILGACRYDKVAELPLKKGARYDKDSEHVVINDVLRETGGCSIILRSFKVSLLFDRNNEPASPYLPPADMVFVLVNRKRGEAFLPEQSRMGNFFGAPSGRLRANMDEIKFTCIKEHSFLPEINDAWLADATLVILKTVQLGEFSKPINIKDFSMMSGARWGYGNNKKKEGKKDLEKISLPENPTKAQVKSYIHAILSASDYQDSWSSDEPQLAMLGKIGEDNLEMLFVEGNNFSQSRSRSSSYYISEVAKRLARPKHKEIILKWLDKYPELVTIVQREGWQNDARETLIKKLKEGPYNLPIEWVQVVASFNDPASYDYIAQYFAITLEKDDCYEIIKKLPGFNLTNAVQNAWYNSKYRPVCQLCEMIPIAMENGSLGALEMGIRVIVGKVGNLNSRRADECQAAIEKFTDAKGSPDDIEKWFNANKDKLTFDSQLKKFVIKQ